MTAQAMGGGTPTGASDGGSALASVKTKSGATTSTSDGGGALPNATADDSAPTDANTGRRRAYTLIYNRAAGA